MNKVFLIGNLTADPEASTTASGISVSKFTLAVQRKFENAEGEKESDFFNIVAWRGIADTCNKYLKKGSKCNVVGRLQNSTYEAKDGTKRYKTDVIVEDIEFLSANKSKPAGETKTTEEKVKAIQGQLEPIDDDSLPF